MAADLFDIDWPNAPGPFPACSFPDLTNNYTGGGIGLTDYGPSDTCTSSPNAAHIVTDDPCPGGTRSLRFAYPVGFGTQGPDFRLPYQVVLNPNNLTVDVWCRFLVKWSANYYWLTSDSKTCIWGGYHDGTNGVQQYQDYYFQTRGLPGNRTAKVVLYNYSVNGGVPDGMVRATNVTILPGVWYRWEWWAHYGVNGFVKCRVNGVDLAWAAEAGVAWDPNDHDNSMFLGVNYIKLDGTYNVYNTTELQDWITANGTMYKHFGRWGAGTTGWLGSTIREGDRRVRCVSAAAVLSGR